MDRVFKIKDIQELLISKISSEYNAQEKLIIANEFINNQILGYSQYGLAVFSRLLDYDKGKNKTKLIVDKKGGITKIDCGRRFASVGWNNNKEEIFEKTKSNGAHITLIKNNTTYIMASYPIIDIVNAGFVGISIMYINGNIVGYKGIGKPFIGNNPIAVGLPYKKNRPYIFDSSLSNISSGELKKRISNGDIESENIIGYDEKGKPTKKYNEVKSLVPIGEYKGLGLLMAVELLIGSLLEYQIGPDKKEYSADNGLLIITFKNNGINLKEYVGALDSSYKDLFGSTYELPGERYRKIFSGVDEVEVDERIISEIETL